MLQSRHSIARLAEILVVLAAAGLSGFLGVLVFVGLVGGVDRPDQLIVTAIVDHRIDGLSDIASAIARLGSFPAVVVVTLVAAAVSIIRTRQLSPAAALVGGVSAVAAAVYLLNIAVARARPEAVLLGSLASDYSFPSGHTADGTIAWLLGMLTATLGAPREVRRTLVGAAIVVCLGIGWSQIYLGYHWPTDVVASWFLAVTAACVATLLRDGAAALSRPAEPHTSDV